MCRYFLRLHILHFIFPIIIYLFLKKQNQMIKYKKNNKSKKKKSFIWYTENLIFTFSFINLTKCI